MKGADQCPRCASRKWADTEQDVTPFYARVLRVCGNCQTAWEPFNEADLLDEGMRYSSFKEPCNNCAFRPGSAEQQDSEKWKALIEKLSVDSANGLCSHMFFCHKGVPLDLEHKTASDSGFAYPYTPDGKPIIEKLRYCCGYLRMSRVQLEKRFAQPQDTKEQEPNG